MIDRGIQGLKFKFYSDDVSHDGKLVTIKLSKEINELVFTHIKPNYEYIITRVST
jgi:hypothetical protein